MPIFISEHFKRQLRKLRKKFPHMKEDLINALEGFNIQNGVFIGKSIYKVRIRSRDISKGKSGGLRAYIYFYVKKDLLVPLCIYSKSERESISHHELQYHFDRTIEELLHHFA